MEKVTIRELQRKFGQVRKQAKLGTVMITHHGHDDLALISAEEYKRLIALDLRSHAVEDLPEHIIEGMDKQPLSKDAHKHEHEYES